MTLYIGEMLWTRVRHSMYAFKYGLSIRSYIKIMYAAKHLQPTKCDIATLNEFCTIPIRKPKSENTNAFVSKEFDDDFYGISEFESSQYDATTTGNDTLDTEIVNTNKRNARHGEKIIPVTFGIIRRDKDNIVLSKRKLYQMKREEKYGLHNKQRISENDTGLQVKVNANEVVNASPASHSSTFTEQVYDKSKQLDHHTTVEVNYFDELLLNEYESHGKNNSVVSDNENVNFNVTTSNESGSNDLNFIDEQYFRDDRQQQNDIESKGIMSSSSVENNISRNVNDIELCEVRSNESNMNLFDEQYIKYEPQQLDKSERKNSEINSEGQQTIRKLEGSIPVIPDPARQKKTNTSLSHKLHEASVINDHTCNANNIKTNYNKLHILDERNDFSKQRHADEKDLFVEKRQTSAQPAKLVKFHRASDDVYNENNKIDFNGLDVEEPKSAYDYVMKIRTEGSAQKTSISTTGGPGIVPAKLERLDSKGFRIMRDWVIDFNKLPRDDIVDILQNNIIYDQNDILAINKPYGLPSHGGPGVMASIGQLLPSFSRALDPSGGTVLSLIHRLDKETSGVMVLGKTPEMTTRLKALFQLRKVIKKYLVITKGVPKTAQGVIDIPLRESKFGGKYKMTVHPEYNDQTRLVMKKSYLQAAAAVTNYRVMDATDDAALIECQPETGKKHQIRVHMSYGLNTPILGDHKYSHFMKIAPQRLPPDMLRRLGIRQSKVRHVPMHLHAQALIFPQFIDGRNVTVTTRPPRHFTKNMSRLKLTFPKS